MPSPTAAINLPAGMILRCLPPEMLAAELAQFEASGAAATEIGLPMQRDPQPASLGQGGVPGAGPGRAFPARFPQAGGGDRAVTSARPDQPAADGRGHAHPARPAFRAARPEGRRTPRPATWPIRLPRTRCARRARPPAQANIVDESQVAPAEEFVPQAAAPAPSSFIPPPRPITTAPLLHQTASLSGKPATMRSTAPMPESHPAAARRARRAKCRCRPDRRSSVPRRCLACRVPSMAPPAAQPAPIPAKAFEFKIPTAPAAPQIPPVAPSVTPSPSTGQPASIPAKAFEFKIPTAPATPRYRSFLRCRRPHRLTRRPTLRKLIPHRHRRLRRLRLHPAPSRPPFRWFAPLSRRLPEILPPAPGVPDANADELQRLAALAMAEIGDKPAEAKADVAPEESEPSKTEKIPDEQPAPAATSAPALEADKPSSLFPPPPAKVEPGSATSRFGLPESPTRDLLAQTTPVVPAPSASATKDTGRLPGRPDLTPRSITTRVTPPAPAAEPTPSAATAVNLNTCSAEDLLPIPGISRTLADCHRPASREDRRIPPAGGAARRSGHDPGRLHQPDGRDAARPACIRRSTSCSASRRTRSFRSRT